MSSFASNQSFIIGYTASGYMDDDWNNCNIVIKLVVSKLSIHY